MGRISAGIGLVSGLNSQEIVSQLISLERRPIDLLQGRITDITAQQTVLLELSARLSGLKTTAQVFSQDSIFKAVTATSSDESIVTVSAEAGTPAGGLDFHVKQLATAHSVISTGFIDSNTTAISPGKIIYADLSNLNGGAGVASGSIEIIDGNGNSAVINLAQETNIGEMVDAINVNTAIQVTASLDGNGLLLTDTSGGDASNLRVNEVGGGTTATDLGLITAAPRRTVEGAKINGIADQTMVADLNGGSGVAAGLIRITDRTGASAEIDLSGDELTIFDVREAINEATGIRVSATVTEDAFVLTDTTDGSASNLIVEDINATTGADLGLLTGMPADSVTGENVNRLGRNTLLSSLNGETGISLGLFDITDANNDAAVIDLSGLGAGATLGDVLDLINESSSISVFAGFYQNIDTSNLDPDTIDINGSLDSLVLIDTTGVSGSLSVTEGSGTTASDLGFTNLTEIPEGQRLVHRAARINPLDINTTYSGTGNLRLMDNSGNSSEVDLSTAMTYGDVILAINSTSGLGINASLQGDHLVLTDTSGGAVIDVLAEEVGSGNAAAALGIATGLPPAVVTGDAINGISSSTLLSRLDGSSKFTPGTITIVNNNGDTADINIRASDTVGDVITAIDGAGLGVTAQLSGDRFLLTDTSNGEDIDLVVADVDGGTAAARLGILAGRRSRVDGTAINTVGSDTALSSLNQGKGIGTVVGNDFTINLRDGRNFSVDLANAQTVGDVIVTINQAVLNEGLETFFSVALSEDSKALILTDKTGGPTDAFSVTAVGTSTAAADLGILKTAYRSFITGDPLIGSLAEDIGVDVSFEVGKGRVNPDTPLELLNGLAGIRRGIIQITDRAGNSAQVDLTTIATVSDAVDAINSAAGSNVTATLGDRNIIVTDQSGGTVASLTIADVSGFAATDLGIAGTTSSGALAGSDILRLADTVHLRVLNDGNGLDAVLGQADLRFKLSNGNQIDVDLSNALTLGNFVEAINTAVGASTDPNGLTIEIAADNVSLRFIDNTSGSGFTIEAINGSELAKQLGIEQNQDADGAVISQDTDSDGVISTDRLLAGFNTVLLKSLNGGQEDPVTGARGLTLGTIEISDSAGISSQIDLSSAQTLRDVIDLINSPQVRANTSASINAAGTGLVLTDNSIGFGDLTISDVGTGTAADDLKIAGTFAEGVSTGGNLQLQYISEATPLAELNGGRGITRGRFRLFNSKGEVATVDLTQGNETTVGDVIREINSRQIGIDARINDTGDGILLEDTAGGALAIRVEDPEGGRTAADLRLAGQGTITENFIDGSFEANIKVLADDTLDDLRNKINAANLGVQATVINDGTSFTPYRLLLTSESSGSAGNILIDSHALDLTLNAVVEARDALVFLGDPSQGGGQAILSHDNQLDNVIGGLSLNLHSPSDGPVSITVERDEEKIVEQMNKFVGDFNTILDRIDEATRFDAETRTRGVLVGEPVVARIQQSLFRAINRSFSEAAGTFTRLAQVGVRVGNGARLSLDEDQFRSALAQDLNSIAAFFTAEDTGVAAVVQKEIDRLTDSVDGLIPRRSDALDQRKNIFNDRIDSLQVLLDRKEQRLFAEFAALEQVLASLQSQQTALAGLSQLIAPAASTAGRT